MQDLFQLLQLLTSSSCLAGLANTGFGLCESVEGWRRGSAGLRPPTPSLHTCNVPLLHASCTNLHNIAISYTVLRYKPAYALYLDYVLLLCTSYTFCMNCTSSLFQKKDLLRPMFLLLCWQCSNVLSSDIEYFTK